MTQFDDFWIHIGPAGAAQESESAGVASAGAFRVSIDRSPAGNAIGSLHLPFSLHESNTVLEPFARSTTRDLARRPVDRPAAADLGLQLYRALFTGDVKSRFDESYGRAAEGQRVLRIRLHIDLDDPDCQRIAGLPWEFLWHPERRQPLALSSQIAVTRYLPVAQPEKGRAFQPPLRILFVASNPRRDLQLGAELQEVTKRLAAEKGECVYDVLEDATFAMLAERITENYHVVHFMGHGDFDGDEGVLLFQDCEVPGARLASLVANQNQTTLVFLNACRTAEIPRRNGRDPFAGVASALVVAGVPAVVAMQFPISDQAAIQFAARFYSQIAQGRAIEEALLAGRQRIQALAPDGDEWATPVLMMRGDGTVFQPSVEALDGDPEERQRAAADLADDSLLPFMADRTDLLFELSEAVRAQDANPSVPLVSIVHGDDSQCQDMLERRLNEIELPKRFGLRPPIKIFRMDWPRGSFQDADQFRRRLTWSFADGAQPNAGLSELIDYIGAFPTPVMVCTHVLASEWKRLGDEALATYLDWWDDWGVHSTTGRVLAFLFVKYETGSGLLSSWRSNRTNDAIATALEHVRSTELRRTGAHRAVRVLPRLEGIGRQDVEVWNAAHGRPLAEEEIRQLYMTWKAETRQDAMPMVEIAARLRALLQRSPKFVEALT